MIIMEINGKTPEIFHFHNIKYFYNIKYLTNLSFWKQGYVLKILRCLLLSMANSLI